jgi:hypothetical protein
LVSFLKSEWYSMVSCGLLSWLFTGQIAQRHN